MTKDTKNLTLEMSAGIVFHNVALGIVAVIVCFMGDQKMMPIFLGLFAGAVSAVLMLTHMAVITERAMDCGDEGYANKTTMVHAMGRKAVYIAILAVVLFRLPQVNPLAMVVGTMGLKTGAYLQPIVHRLGGWRLYGSEEGGLDQSSI